MVMSKDEIVVRYRQAKEPAKQIGILADLNCCTKEEIAEILREAGHKIKGYKKIETPEAVAQQPETPERAAEAPEALATKMLQRNSAERFVLEDILSMIFDALDDYTEAPEENAVRSEAAFIGYLVGIKDAYAALRSPIRR